MDHPSLSAPLNMHSSSTPKHIVFVINDLKGNGAERVVLTLAKGFADRGHICHLVCFNDTIEFNTEGLNVSFFPVNQWRWIPRAWRGRLLAPFLDRKIARLCGQTPDLVLSNLLPCDRILSWSRLRNVHIVVHSILSLERGIQFRELSIYKRKPVVCVSDGVLNDLIDLLPNRDKDACVIHNPVDPHKIRTQALESAPLPQRPFIVHVGKFKTEKRHDVLLRAFAQSSYTGDLVLVGQGPLQAQLEALCKELQISDRVHFWGFHPNPYPIIKASELLVLCSDYEGLGMVLLEALSLNTPVLSTDCPGGPRDALLARQLVPNNDIAALATALSVGDFSGYRGDLSSKFLLNQALNSYEGLAKSERRKFVGQRDRLANTYDALTKSK